MAGRSAKAIRVRDIVRIEFRKNSVETDPEKIENLRNSAIQGLANYLTIESVSKLKRKQFTETNAASVANAAAKAIDAPDSATKM
jgi:hypothetical protein